MAIGEAVAETNYKYMAVTLGLILVVTVAETEYLHVIRDIQLLRVIND